MREASVEGLHLSVHVASDKITTSEMLRVEVVVRSAESLKVTMPELNESTGKWGDFLVFESRTSPARLDEEGMVVQSSIYILEPDIPGVSMVTGLTVTGDDASGKSVKVTSQPVAVKVASVLVNGENNIQDIAPNDRVVEQDGSPRWQIALVIFNVTVVIGLILLWLSRKRNKKIGDGRLYQDFENLKTAPVVEVMSGIERVVCRVLAQQWGIKLTKVDFAGLREALGGPITQVAGLGDAIASYERIQYARRTVDESEVRGLYTHFESIINQQAKEMVT